jgi:hypothetical protein
VTNAELTEALRIFWPDDGQEAAAFLGALRECVNYAMDADIDFEFAAQFAAVADALDGPPAADSQHAGSSPQARLLDAAAHGGLTIDSAARLLGVSRWQARQHLAGLRDAGSLHVHRQGRASRWVRDAE